MNIRDLYNLRLFVILVLVQALVLNYVQIFGCCTPLLYIYIILQLPRAMKKWQLYLWGFFTGLTIDIFLNTPGEATIACTTMAAFRPYILESFLNMDSAADFKPSIKQMGFNKFMSYAGMFSLIYCILFFTIDLFTFWHFGLWLLSIIGSFVLTFAMIAAIAIAKQH